MLLRLLILLVATGMTSAILVTNTFLGIRFVGGPALAQLSTTERDPETLIEAAETLRYRRQFVAAQAALTQALQLYRHQQDVEGQARVHFELGNLASRQAQYLEAAQAYQQALNLAQHLDEADAETAQKFIAQKLTATQAAATTLVNFDRARATGDRKQQAQLWVQQAEFHLEQQQPELAVVPYRRAVQLYQVLGEQRQHADVLILLARLYQGDQQLEQYPQVVRFYQQALTLYQQLGDRTAQRQLLLTLGNYYANHDQPQLALTAYRQALQLVSGNRAQQVKLLPKIARIYTQLPAGFPQAIASFQQAVENAEALNQHKEQLTLLQELGGLFYRQGRLTDALQTWQQGLTLANTLKALEQQKVLLMWIGDVYRWQQQDAKAVVIYQRALRTGEQTGEANTTLYLRLGQVYEGQHQVEQAIAHYQQIHRTGGSPWVSEQAVAAAQQMRSQLTPLRQALAGARTSETPRQAAVLLNQMADIYAQRTCQSPSTHCLVPQAMALRHKAISLYAQVGEIETQAKLYRQVAVDWQAAKVYPWAIEAAQTALMLARRVGNVQSQAATFTQLATLYQANLDYPQAAATYQQLLRLTRVVQDQPSEAVTLYNLGAIADWQSHPQQAQVYFQQALAQADATAPFRQFIREFYQSLGKQYQANDDYTQARDAYRQAVALSATPEPDLLSHLGLAHYHLGEYPQAQQRFEQAYEQAQTQGEPESLHLQDLGLTYFHLGQYQKALSVLQQARHLVQAPQTRLQCREPAELITSGTAPPPPPPVGLPPRPVPPVVDVPPELPRPQSVRTHLEVVDRPQPPEYLQCDRTPSPGKILNAIGAIYSRLGQYQQAHDHFQQALAHLNPYDDPFAVALRSNLGAVAARLGRPEQAMAAYRFALASAQSMGNRRDQGKVLTNLGQLRLQQRQVQAATVDLQQALAIHTELGEHYWQSVTLQALGDEAVQRRQAQQALRYYRQALAIAAANGSRYEVSRLLARMGQVVRDREPGVAIALWKQSINLTEAIRQEIRTLPPDERTTFIETVATTYRDLADLLLQQDRVLEAQRVLDLLKVQELDDYLRQVRGNSDTATGIPVLQPEQAILERFQAEQASAIQLGQELADLRQIPPAERTSAQQARIARLVTLQQELNQDFNQFIDHPTVQAALDQLSRTAQRQTVDLADLDGLRDTLQQLNAVILYPLILEDRLELVITTPNSAPLRRTIAVDRRTLNQTIVRFRRALQDPYNTQVQALAQQLYTWLVQPIEADLKQAQTQSIIYAPDGQLRYIPLAALHDGEQWLVQRLQINNITAKSLTNFSPQTAAPLNILAGAFVEGHYDVAIGAERFSFAGLPFAGKEVDQLVAAVPGTVGVRDRDFNLATFQPRMNDHSVVHLATHAAFVPGQPDASFILFGNGDRATLRDIGSWSLFNVDLVVLSACETGLGGKLGNGEEILGLGYQFQNRGAKATLASLWRVDDGGTQVLMTAFYAALKKGNRSKAGALRQAQIALLTGDFSAVGGERGGIRVVKPAGQDSNRNPQPFVHPYYWAPFILIGNGL